MLEEVAPGVLVRQSAFCLSNAVVVEGDAGALLVDPGVDGADLRELAGDLAARGLTVGLGFATHPHWDHVLWDERFGDVPRIATAACAAAARARAARLREQVAQLAPGADAALAADLSALAADATRLDWPGPEVGVVEHRAHAPGHAALVVGGAGLLVAGDMLSDVEIPLFDPDGEDPARDYLDALDRLEDAVEGGVTTLVPGHGAVARGAGVRERLAADRAYVEALLAGADPQDPRVGPGAAYGTDWLPAAHERNAALARG